MALNENAKKLVEALRSGKYEQGRNRLRDGDKYCCLGVACEISGMGVWEEGTSPHYPHFSHHYVLRTIKEAQLLPRPVAKWLGFRATDGGFASAEGPACLSDLNDDGTSFPEIADIIESEPEGLFVK